MGLDDVLDQREAEPGSLLGGREPGVEDAVPFVRRNPRPVVLDVEPSSIGKGTDGDRHVVAPVLYGVGKEVLEHVGEAFPVGRHRRLLRVEISSEGGVGRRDVLPARSDHLRDRDRFDGVDPAAGSREDERLVDDPLHPLEGSLGGGQVLVVTLLATVLILAVVFTGRPNRFPDVTAVTTYLAAGLFALGCLFVIYFTSTTSEMYFRVFGLMMVFALVLASITIYEGLHVVSDWLSPTAAQTIVAGAFAALLVLSLLSVFASPYVYRQSQHVSEQQLHGYETAFDNAADGTTFAGFRGAPNRYADALNGQETRTRAHTSITPETVEQGPMSYYDTDRYLVVSQLDYEREVVAYRGLRYSDDDFAALVAPPSINRVQSNGEFTTYYVPASDDTT